MMSANPSNAPRSLSSAGRAEATRQALMADGIGEARFRKIEGVADREPLVRDKPGDPRNRRISILLMR